MSARSHLPDAVHEAAFDGDPVALTRILVATPSVNPVLEPGGAGEEEIARLTARWLEQWGFSVTCTEVAPGRFNTVGRLGSEGPSLILNGHLDTVGIEGMTILPFAATLRDGRIWGRGACDMKAGVASLLSAARSWARSGPTRGRLTVALTADEEHASLGMQALVAAGAGADAAVVCEPTGLAVMPAHKGFLWMDLRFRGRAAHGSRPEIGIDAIRHAGHALVALDAYDRGLRTARSHPLLGPGSLHAGTIQGGTAPSVYPADCHLVVERRTLPGEDSLQVQAELEEALHALERSVPDFDLEATPGLYRAGTEVPIHHPVVSGLHRALEDEGMAPRTEGMTAWVDAAFLNETGTPAVCFGPGSIAHAHTADEHVPISEVEACARVLSRFTRAFLEP